MDCENLFFAQLVKTFEDKRVEIRRGETNTYFARHNPVSQAILSSHYDPVLGNIYTLSHNDYAGIETTFVSGDSNDPQDPSVRVLSEYDAQILKKLYNSVHSRRREFKPRKRSAA